MEELDPRSLVELEAVVGDPVAYVAAWKERTGRQAIGTFPMNFPSELVIAAGALPVILQASREPISEGRNLLAEFYCGYTRSLVDQAARGALDVFDAFVVADHCVQLLGAVDVIHDVRPAIPLQFAQFISSLDEPWADGQVRGKVAALRAEIEGALGATITDEATADAIRTMNRNRTLLRRFHELRRDGLVRIKPSQMQTLIASSMIMDLAEHTPILEAILASLRPADERPDDLVKVHLSGHFCHGARAELLDTIEECGALVIDDDLYTGYRYISTDVAETGDPIVALATWYRDRNTNAPCPTRVQTSVDWDAYLVKSVEASGAQGVIVLMAKFCEPHMLYYPELRRTLEDNDIPLLLIEAEHEGNPLESVRTRVETFVERIRRRDSRVPELV